MLDEDQAWLAYRAGFACGYDDQNYGNSLQARVMRAGHRFLERTLPKSSGPFPCVLEVGAGTGEHVSFVAHPFERYLISDLDAGALKFARRKLSEGNDDQRYTYLVQGAERLAVPDGQVDRLIAAHVLEHLERPHQVIKQWQAALKPGGILSVLLPTDPGLAWRLGKHLGPRRAALARGLPYDYIMAREHVNACYPLLGLLKFYFPEHRLAWWPLAVPSTDLNLFVAFHAQKCAA